MEQHRSPATASAHRQASWERGFQSLWDEHDYWIDEVEGTIPPDLHGTLWRNGPGVLDRGGQRFGHPFDGDGMICRIAFGDGRAHFRNRFVRTGGWLREQRAGKIVYRGVFGTDKPGGFLRNAFDFRLKNIANTNVVYWAGKLWALWEAAQPHRLDPWTLETMGLDDLGGRLGGPSPSQRTRTSICMHPARHAWLDSACKPVPALPPLMCTNGIPMVMSWSSTRTPCWALPCCTTSPSRPTIMYSFKDH